MAEVADDAARLVDVVSQLNEQLGRNGLASSLSGMFWRKMRPDSANGALPFYGRAAGDRNNGADLTCHERVHRTEHLLVGERADWQTVRKEAESPKWEKLVKVDEMPIVQPVEDTEAGDPGRRLKA